MSLRSTLEVHRGPVRRSPASLLPPATPLTIPRTVPLQLSLPSTLEICPSPRDHPCQPKTHDNHSHLKIKTKKSLESTTLRLPSRYPVLLQRMLHARRYPPLPPPSPPHRKATRLLSNPGPSPSCGPPAQSPRAQAAPSCSSVWTPTAQPTVSHVSSYTDDPQIYISGPNLFSSQRKPS